MLLNALLLAVPNPGTLKQAHPLMMRSRPNWEAELGRGERRDESEWRREFRGEDLVDEREPFDGRTQMMLSGYLRAVGAGWRPEEDVPHHHTPSSLHPSLRALSFHIQHSWFVTVRSNIRSSPPLCTWNSPLREARGRHGSRRRAFAGNSLLWATVAHHFPPRWLTAPAA